MSTATKAKDAIAQIEGVMDSLDDHQFDTAWYLLSMTKLALLEVASPDNQCIHHIIRLISATEPDDVPIPSKKH